MPYRSTPKQAVLIATLGAEPQVVSLATQWLRLRGEALSAVVVIHTDPTLPPIDRGLLQLQQFFADQPDQPPLHLVECPIADVLEAAEMEQFGQTLYSTIKQWLSRNLRIHLLLAGGRKSMALVGMSVAQLLLGTEDQLWVLHSDEGLRKSGRFLRSDGDQVQLIAIPLSPLSPAPQLTRPFQAETPDAARAALVAEQQRHIQRFLEHGLTAAEREIALLVAQDVLTVKEIAARLHKSPKTVTNQLNTIYSKLESEFGLQPDVGVKREFLRRELNSRGSRE